MRPTRGARFVFVATVAALAVPATPAASAPGDLDPTFDDDGRVSTEFAFERDEASALAIQADGKIVAAGVASVNGADDFALARFNVNGAPDTTFDGNGRVTTDLGSTADRANAVAIQADGRIVVAGCSVCGGGGDFVLTRYNPDGSLDTTFDADGKVTTDFAGGGDSALGLAIQPDGKIVAVGFATLSGTFFDFALARYNTDGSLDPTFDGDGKVTADFAGGQDIARGVVLQEDGRIVVAGEASIGAPLDFAVARYHTDGSLDATFDGDGRVTTDFGSFTDEALALAIQGDGKIVAAGVGVVGAPFDFALARYNIDGSLDTTFDGDGKVNTDFGSGDDGAFAVLIQPDGKIVAAGRAEVSGEDDFALARYGINGSLDATFGGGDGKATTHFAAFDRIFGAAIQADRKIVGAGCLRCGSVDSDFALARYTVCRRSSKQSSIPC